MSKKKFHPTFCIHALSAGPSDHLLVAEGVYELLLEREGAPDDDAPGGQVDAAAERGGGDQNAQRPLAEGALDYVTLVKR